MVTRVHSFERQSDRLFCEITHDGCYVEVARGSIERRDDCQVETHDFEAPSLASEYVEQQLRVLLEAGFRSVHGEQPLQLQPLTSSRLEQQADPLATIELLLSREPVVAHNSEMLAAIQADPDNEKNYLVYADWLQEQGDPRGHLVMMHYHAGHSRAHKQAANALIHGLGDHLLPVDARSSVGLEWYLGFVRTAARATVTVLEHPSCAVLQELSMYALDFTTFAGTRQSLPCLWALRLDNYSTEDVCYDGPPDKPFELLTRDQAPRLAQLCLRDVTAVGVALADLPQWLLEQLELLDVAADEMRLDSDVLERIAGLERRPRLCVTTDFVASTEALHQLAAVFDLDHLCRECGVPLSPDNEYQYPCFACGHDPQPEYDWDWEDVVEEEA